MSKRSRRRSADTSPRIANLGLLRRFELPDLRLFEDRRSFYPEAVRPARGLFSWSSDVIVAENKNRSQRRADMNLPFRLAFRVPRDTFICVRRKQRREVLFARRRTGKGARASVRHRSDYSDVRC